MDGFKRINILQQGKRNTRELIIFKIVIILFLVGLLYPGPRMQVLAGNSIPVVPSPEVYYNGEALGFDVFPLFCQEPLQGGALFPLRGIFEAYGFTVVWDPVAKKVLLTGPGRVVYLFPGNPLFSVNGVVYRTARPPAIIKGRIMVALDFLQQSADWEELNWDEKEGVLHLKGCFAENAGSEEVPLPGEDEISRYDLNLVEILLPADEAVTVGENFKIIITAPLIPGIYAYAINFSYDPGFLEVQGLKNPVLDPRQEFAWQRIDNVAGTAEYMQTVLGSPGKISPHDPLAVLEVKALRTGTLSLPEDMLEIILLDATAAPLPAGLEVNSLRICDSTA